MSLHKGGKIISGSGASKEYIDDNVTVVESKINKNKITNGAFISLSETITGTTLDVVTGTTANEVSRGDHTHSDYVPKNGSSAINGTLTVQDIAFTSDSRLKENIISYKEQPLKSLDAKYFTWKNGDNKRELGYIAQEVRVVYPEFVSEDNNGVLSINKGAIHTAKIAELEYQIELIKNELLKLQNKN